MNERGSLCVVGSGIAAPAQTTVEAIAQIEHADLVLALIPDPFTEHWIRSLNTCVESLVSLYAPGKPRNETYVDIADRVLTCVRDGLSVCAVTYGHPGVFATPFHDAVARARAEGFAARMLPGISADACLFADCGIDPSQSGSQSYEATDFLLRSRPFDTAAGLLLWQIGVVGERSFLPQATIWSEHGFRILLERLMRSYPPDHVVIVYEAARYPGIEPGVQFVALSQAAQAVVTPMSTMYVPPSIPSRIDREMARRLHLDVPVAVGR